MFNPVYSLAHCCQIIYVNSDELSNKLQECTDNKGERKVSSLIPRPIPSFSMLHDEKVLFTMQH